MKKLILSLVAVLFFTFMISFPSKIHADSGFDFDYDVGGSDWGSSDWGGSDWGDFDWGSSNSSGHWNSDSSDGGFIIFFTIEILVIFFIIYMTSKATTNSARKKSYLSVSEVPEEKIKELLPNFNEVEFKKHVYQSFVDIQNAWTNFELEKVRHLMSDELYNMYTTQLNTLKIKGQKNIMEDFVKKSIVISNVSEENGKVSLQVRLVVSFKDYIVDKNNQIVRGMKKDFITSYNLTYVISKKQIEKVTCPNCHAKIDMNQSGVCPYCDSVIITEEFDYILTKKQFIRKERG